MTPSKPTQTVPDRARDGVDPQRAPSGAAIDAPELIDSALVMACVGWLNCAAGGMCGTGSRLRIAEVDGTTSMSCCFARYSTVLGLTVSRVLR